MDRIAHAFRWESISLLAKLSVSYLRSFLGATLSGFVVGVLLNTQVNSNHVTKISRGFMTDHVNKIPRGFLHFLWKNHELDLESVPFLGLGLRLFGQIVEKFLPDSGI